MVVEKKALKNETRYYKFLPKVGVPNFPTPYRQLDFNLSEIIRGQERRQRRDANPHL